MSKSLGNGTDPLELIDKYGADALRFMLTTGITPGNDMRFKEDRLEAARNFANKLWNASRFVIMNIRDDSGNFMSVADMPSDLKDEDKWIISRVNDAIKYVTDAMERFDLALAGQRVYDLIWNEYCDWYIEIVKSRLYGDDENDKKTARSVLVSTLKDMLRMLHPFMPYITEEIWTYLPKMGSEASSGNGYLIKETWPEYDDAFEYPEEVSVLETAMEIIRAVRNIRAEANASPGKKLSAVVAAGGNMDKIRVGARYILDIANITDIKFIFDKREAPKDAVTAVINDAEIFIPLDELVDFEAEFTRLAKEKKRLEGEVKRSDKMLNNPGFISKAPEKKINEEKKKKIQYEDMLAKISDQLDIIGKK